MRSEFLLRGLLMVVVCVLGWIGDAFACSCLGSLPPRKEMGTVDAVVTGKVVKITPVKFKGEMADMISHFTVEVQLTKVIKGKGMKAGDTVNIRTGSGGGDCGYPFEEGSAYLIYAYRRGPSFETSICTRTQLLEGAEEEVLELLGKLPKIEAAPQAPEVSLRGKINDAGYKGIIFEFRNRLHTRIFYSQFQVQVFRDGKWENHPAFRGIETAPEPSAEERKRMLADQREEVAFEEKEDYMRRLRKTRSINRVSSTSFFAAIQSNTLPWRIGFQYVTEAALDGGGKISHSKDWVWGQRVEASTIAPTLTFEQAFWGTQQLPDPLGEMKEAAP